MFGVNYTMNQIFQRKFGSGGIRTHASGETGALIQRLRPLGHATLLVLYPLFGHKNQ